MKSLIIKTKIVLFLFMSSIDGHSQDINFSQFYEIPLLRNPALAGLYKGDFRATTAYRNQWENVTTPYVTQALGLEVKLAALGENNYLALGLQLTNDLAGDSRLGKTQILPCLTFHKSLNGEEDTYLSIGFMGGPVLQQFDPSRLQFDDQFINGSYSSSNPTRENFSNTSKSYLDAGAGILFSNKTSNNLQYYVGGSFLHFNKPRVAFDRSQDIRLNHKIMVNAGLSIPQDNFNKITLYGDYFVQGGNRQVQGGIIYCYDLEREDDDETISLEMGTLFRWNDAVIPVAKLNYYNIGMGITYDVNISKLKTASMYRGGLEVTLSYRNFLNYSNSSLNKTRCPVAF